MKIGYALGLALKTYRTHFGELMQGMLLQVVLRLAVMAPLLFLSQSATVPLALLTPVLFVLVVLPLRQNAAQGMQRALRGERYFTPQLVSFEGYGRKVLAGLKTGGMLLLWGLPCLLVTIAFVLCYRGLMDAATLLRFFMNLGMGKFTVGVMVALVIYLLTFLPLLAGMALLSWRRHGHALGLHKGAAKKKGWRILLLHALGEITLLPFLAVTLYISQGYLSQLVQALSGLATGNVTLPPLTENLWLVLAAFVVLFLPLVPLKNLLPAAFVKGMAEEKKA